MQQFSWIIIVIIIRMLIYLQCLILASMVGSKCLMSHTWRCTTTINHWESSMFYKIYFLSHHKSLSHARYWAKKNFQRGVCQTWDLNPWIPVSAVVVGRAVATVPPTATSYLQVIIVMINNGSLLHYCLKKATNETVIYIYTWGKEYIHVRWQTYLFSISFSPDGRLFLETWWDEWHGTKKTYD